MSTSNELQVSPSLSHDGYAPKADLSKSAIVPAAERLRLIPVLFVSILAFLLASFPVRNIDFLPHLAKGRELARPAANSLATVQDNATWLYDLACFALYSAAGGAGLVVVKALLVALLGLILLRLSLSGSGWWIAATCTALALLTLSTRLLLQPAIVSYFFMTLTVWFLWRDNQGDRETGRQGDRESTPGVRGWLPPWPLMVVFVFWVNMDHWFVLGLAVVAVVWLGRVLDLAMQTKGLSLLACLAPRLLVSLAVLCGLCLLNPSHVHAFAPPPELASPASLAVASTAGHITAPFQKSYFTTFGSRPAFIAYFPLLGLGLLSFALSFRNWSWQRFIPWLGLALLSAFQVKAIPFFAIVGCPVLAWNLQELLARLADREVPAADGSLPRTRVWTIEGLQPSCKLIAATLGVACLVCAWPGWLQARPFEPRRWAIELPPALERAAAVTNRWHEQGLLDPQAQGLHTSPDTLNAFAWFCPQERGLQNEPLAAGALGEPGGAKDWDQQMRNAGIKYLIVYHPDRERFNGMLFLLLANPQQWPLLDLGGGLAIFGWRDPAKTGGPDPFKGLELDLNRLAFRPTKDKRAPHNRPGREPEQRLWSDAFWKPALPWATDRDEAEVYLFYSDLLRPGSLSFKIAGWEALQAGGLVAGAGGLTPLGRWLDADVRLKLFHPPPRPKEEDPASDPPFAQHARTWLGRFTQQQDDVPAALFYLSIRAARRALAANPEDAQAYYILGESYVRLFHATRERVWGGRLQELVELRRAQASAAFNQAISLDPTLAKAHLQLGVLYGEMNYLDLALEQLRAFRRLTWQPAFPRGSKTQQPPAELLQFEKDLSKLAKDVGEAQAAYEVQKTKMKVLDRANMALQSGLAGKALEALQESDIAMFGYDGAKLELELLIRTGQYKKVRDWTQPEHIAAIGASPYHWLRTEALAAAGDYALAQEECKQLAFGEQQGTPEYRLALAQSIGKVVLDCHPGIGGLPYALGQVYFNMEFRNRASTLGRGVRQEGDIRVLHGLLLLEEGQTDEAEVAFRYALDTWKDEESAASGATLDFNGRTTAQGCLGLLSGVADERR